MHHSFDTTIAEECGIPAAILFNHLSFWIIKNKENQKYFFDGTYWTYSSVKALCGMFCYMSRDRIIGGLNALEANGYILTGNYNEDAKDRTKWYAITEKGYLQLGKSVEPITENPKCNSMYNINNTITDITTDIINGDSSKHPSDVDEFFDSVWRLYPKKLGKSSVKKTQRKKLMKVGFDVLEKCIENYKSYISSHGIQEQYIMYGSTFFNGRYVDWMEDIDIPAAAERVKEGGRE